MIGCLYTIFVGLPAARRLTPAAPADQKLRFLAAEQQQRYALRKS